MIVEQFAHLCVWAGSDLFRWKMKDVGWTGWSVASVSKDKPAEEVGYEKE